MNRYELEVAKLESRTPLFYYPYSIKLKEGSEYAKPLLALHFRERGPIRPLTAKDLESVNETNLRKLGGKYFFHYEDPQESEGARIAAVRSGALRQLGKSGAPCFKELLPEVTTYSPQLRPDVDFEIVIGERVEIEQPKKMTFDDIPDLMGINEDAKSAEKSV